jgi:hypothetical protein
VLEETFCDRDDLLAFQYACLCADKGNHFGRTFANFATMKAWCQEKSCERSEVLQDDS